jgi:hypothetical protein
VITDPAKSISFTATPTGDCGSAAFEYQVTISPTSTTANLISLPTSTTPSISFAQTTNTADAKTYTVTVKARPAGTTTWLSPTTATYTYNNPCLSATITMPTLSSMTNSVLKQTTPGGSPFYETQTATASDSISALSSANACGGYQYSISSVATTASTALSASDLTIDSATGKIQLYTANSNTVGTHTATVRVSLASYPTISRTASFTITIDKCELTSFTMSALSSQSYNIGNLAKVWAITGSTVVTQVPVCGYSYTLTSSTTSTIVTASPGASISFSAYSIDVANVGSFPILVTATLDSTNNYPYSAPTPPCQSSFTLTVLDPPCTTTSITTAPASIENLVAFAGYTVSSKIKYTFNDTVSIS